MSTVAVTDKRGGVFEVVITFTYGECARLPFNSLRKVNARLDQVPHGGIKATSQFNLRNSSEAANFVEVLDLFGEDGSYVHGSPADPDELKKDEAVDDEEPGLWAAATGNARMESAGSSPEMNRSAPVVETPAAEASDASEGSGAPVASGAAAGEESAASAFSALSVKADTAAGASGIMPSLEEPDGMEEEPDDTGVPEESESGVAPDGGDAEVPDDLVAEDELSAPDASGKTGDEVPLPASKASSKWEREGDKAVAVSIRKGEDRQETLRRVSKAAGARYTVDRVRNRLIECAYHKFKDIQYVASFLQLRGWDDVQEADVQAVVDAGASGTDAS